MPPTTTAMRRSLICEPYSLVASATCMASSRVGVNTSTCTPLLLLGGMLEMRFRAGSMKAAVLPLPVCEETIRSWPARALGMAAAWTEVGSVKPAFRTADNRVGARHKVSKDMSIICRSNGIHIALGRGSEPGALVDRSEEHTSELQSLMRISYAV